MLENWTKLNFFFKLTICNLTINGQIIQKQKKKSLFFSLIALLKLKSTSEYIYMLGLIWYRGRLVSMNLLSKKKKKKLVVRIYYYFMCCISINFDVVAFKNIKHHSYTLIHTQTRAIIIIIIIWCMTHQFSTLTFILITTTKINIKRYIIHRRSNS